MDKLSFPDNLRNVDIARLERDLKTKPETYWQRRGETRALLLFQQMAKRVPAYKDYLKKHKVNPAKIKTIADFKHIPTVDKRGYLKQYDLEKLCWDGKFSTKQWTLSSTSGTTGEPFYFPRTEAQDRQYALSAELYLRSNFQIHKKKYALCGCFCHGRLDRGIIYV
jgi:phenylacetate-CoA ligase